MIINTSYQKNEAAFYRKCHLRAKKEVDGQWYCLAHANLKTSEIAVEALKKVVSHLDNFTDEEIEGAPGMATGDAILALERLGIFDF